MGFTTENKICVPQAFVEQLLCREAEPISANGKSHQKRCPRCDVFACAVPCAVSTTSAEFASVLAGSYSHFLAAKLSARTHFIPVCHFMALLPACLSASLPFFLVFFFYVVQAGFKSPLQPPVLSS